MNLMMLLDMAAAGFDDRVAFGTHDHGVTYTELLARAEVGAAQLRELGVEHLVYVATNGPEFPVALFAAARAEIPLVPVNYRLGHDQLHELLGAHPSSLVIVEEEVRELVGDAGRGARDPGRVDGHDRPCARRRPGARAVRPRGDRALALHLGDDRRTEGCGAAPPAPVART